MDGRSSEPPSAAAFDAAHVLEETGPNVVPDLVAFYDDVNRQLNQGPFGKIALFLNYGYIPDAGPRSSKVSVGNEYIDRNSAELILELLGDVDLRPEHSVLDVGCGRGGAVSVIRRYFQVGNVTGVDLSREAIAFCREQHADARTEFVVGDALDLPSADRAHDVVISVESSHSYRSFEKFYREVRRVLRHGGWFLYTDLLPAERIPDIERDLEAAGFELRFKQEITANVLRSCDATAARKAQAFAHGNDVAVLGHFLGAPGSAPYEGMKSGNLRYMLYRLAAREESNGESVGSEPRTHQQVGPGEGRGAQMPGDDRDNAHDSTDYRRWFGSTKSGQGGGKSAPFAPGSWPWGQGRGFGPWSGYGVGRNPFLPPFLPYAGAAGDPEPSGGSPYVSPGNADSDYQPVVPLKRNGSEPPLFIVHAILGSVFRYHGLTRYMEREQPLYAIRARGLDGRQPPIDSVDEMARLYADAICYERPIGTIHLAGYSFGSWIAYQIAQELRKRDRDVGELILFGFMAPGSLLPGDLRQQFSFMSTYIHDMFRLLLNSAMVDFTQRGGVRPGIEQFLPPMLRVVLAHLRAHLTFSPQRWAQGAHIMRTAEQEMFARADLTLGWGKLCDGAVKNYQLPGNHLSMFDEPFVKATAEKINEILGRSGS